MPTTHTHTPRPHLLSRIRSLTSLPQPTLPLLSTTNSPRIVDAVLQKEQYRCSSPAVHGGRPSSPNLQSCPYDHQVKVRYQYSCRPAHSHPRSHPPFLCHEVTPPPAGVCDTGAWGPCLTGLSSAPAWASAHRRLHIPRRPWLHKWTATAAWTREASGGQARRCPTPVLPAVSPGIRRTPRWMRTRPAPSRGHPTGSGPQAWSPFAGGPRTPRGAPRHCCQS